MSFNYASLASTALKQITKFGRSVTLRTVTTGTFDTGTGVISGASDADVTVKAVVTGYKDKQIDGQIIRSGDKQVMIAGSALTTAPKTNDIVVDSGDYKIVNIETIQPGDTVLIYKLQVRK